MRLLCLTVIALVLSACGHPGGPEQAPPGNYDLAPGAISWSPDPVDVGDEVSFTYSVENRGTDAIPARTYEVEFYVGGKLVSFDRAPPLPLEPGLDSTYSNSPGYFDFKASEPGKVRYRLVLDPGDRLSETDEANNVAEGDLDVQVARGNPQHE